MNRLGILALFFLSPHINTFGQTSCIKYWSKNQIQNKQLDTIISKLDIGNIDTLYCDSFTVNSPFNHKWYINFYNKQFGKYFSNAKCVNFLMFHFRQETDSLSGEIHITQFDFDNKDMNLIKKTFGRQSKGFRSYHLEAWTSYKYIVINNSIYFISTESFYLMSKNNSLFEKVFNEFLNYR
jgi:hypothetical protein